MNPIRWLLAGIGMEAGRKVVDALDEQRKQERRARRRNIAIVAVSIVGLVLLAGVFLSLIKWAIGLVLLAALGYGVWYFVGPPITRFLTNLRAGRRERKEAQEAARTADARQQEIERKLEEIKRDVGSGPG